MEDKQNASWPVSSASVLIFRSEREDKSIPKETVVRVQIGKCLAASGYQRVHVLFWNLAIEDKCVLYNSFCQINNYRWIYWLHVL